jgi:hypothetical protein
MNQNYKLVLTAGAPGSAWSMMSNRVKRALAKRFDRTDETDERTYYIPEDHKNEMYDVKDPTWKATTHNGSYFGPYHEFGHGFDDIPKNYTTESFKAECLKPFLDPTRTHKLVRSHWFSYNLDWIWDNMKGHKLLLVWRDAEKSRDWWYSMGGWNINFPVYTWYDNPDRMWEKIQEETNLIWKFGEKHNLEWMDYDNDDQWILSKFPNAKKTDHKADIKINDTIKIAYLDIE